MAPVLLHPPLLTQQRDNICGPWHPSFIAHCRCLAYQVQWIYIRVFILNAVGIKKSELQWRRYETFVIRATLKGMKMHKIRNEKKKLVQELKNDTPRSMMSQFVTSERFFTPIEWRFDIIYIKICDIYLMTPSTLFHLYTLTHCPLKHFTHFNELRFTFLKQSHKFTWQWIHCGS